MLIPCLLLSAALGPLSQADSLADARAALAEGRTEAAERLLNQLAAEDEQHLEARLLLAELLLARPRPNAGRVIELLDPWSAGTDARVMLQLGALIAFGGVRRTARHRETSCKAARARRG